MTPVAGWYPDPIGRHEQRYWDGARWTDHGADLGIDRLDGRTASAEEEAWAERVEDAPDLVALPPNVSDADCAGGKGDGPHYVTEKDIRVVGPDVFDLDTGGVPGIGCESR